MITSNMLSRRKRESVLNENGAYQRDSGLAQSNADDDGIYKAEFPTFWSGHF